MKVESGATKTFSMPTHRLYAARRNVQSQKHLQLEGGFDSRRELTPVPASSSKFLLRSRQLPMRDLLLIALCGALGAVCRYGAGLGVHRLAGPHFPWGTLVVNVAGCFLLGCAAEYALHRKDLAVHYHKALTVGFLGALTTFSTFGLETIRALEKDWRLGLLNAAANLAIGLIAVCCGIWVGRGFAGE